MDCGFVPQSIFVFIGVINISTKYYVIAVFAILLFYSVILAAGKKKKPLKRAFYTMIFGIVALLSVNLAGNFTGVYLPVSPLSLTVSSALGVPGIAAMLTMSLIL